MHTFIKVEFIYYSMRVQNNCMFVLYVWVCDCQEIIISVIQLCKLLCSHVNHISNTSFSQEIAMEPRQRHQANGAEQHQLELNAYPVPVQQSLSSTHSQTRLQGRPRGGEETPQKSVGLLIIKWTALCIVALCLWTATVVSKVSVVSITGRMFSLSESVTPESRNDRVRSVLFIQLVFLLLIPEVLSFIRCLCWGVIGKSTKKYPWPTRREMFEGFITTLIEVAALCGFVFGVACRLPPSLTILILNGCFCFPIGYYLIVGKLRHLCTRGQSHHEYSQIGSLTVGNNNTLKKYIGRVQTALEIGGLLIQLGVVVAAIPAILDKKENKDISILIILPISLLLISFVWSGWIQQRTYSKTQQGSARLKAGLITSAMRILFIPFVSYIYARFLLDFEVSFHPQRFVWHDLELSTFLTHVLVSFVAYMFAWIACTLQSWAFLIPMLLSTPTSFLWYLGCAEGHQIFPFKKNYFVDWNIEWYVLVVASLLWISQYLAFAYHIFKNSDDVLANEEDLVWMPHYNSVFLEQQLVLNKKTAITGYSSEYNSTSLQRIREQSKDNYVFICSTMYHENEVEMRQLLRSINNVTKSNSQQNNRNHKYESHIFFDNACSGTHLNNYVMQLLGLLEKTLDIHPKDAKVFKMPYGIQLKYRLKGSDMPFHIHLKDNNKVKRKKRWSQVMYMNYIIRHRIVKDDIPKNKAFILTTDADIEFTCDSVVALLDILARDGGVGAVCARTHPLGDGPVVWYQKFDYAIGHWFQKAAEHILGSVLCCPGCFSVFRVLALERNDDGEQVVNGEGKSVLETYGSSVENGFDFLTKDMGEDRWLCTLLIQDGWRLEYSAVSQDSTYCPDNFEEFYKQRRRWIPSTLANLAEVIGNYDRITANNDSITMLFILYEFLIVFSSLISPATVILIIVTGLRAIDESLDEVSLIVVLSIVSVLYGALCVYATDKTQLMAAKVLTLIFSIIMAVVISGVVTDTINSAINGNPTGPHSNNNDMSNHTNNTDHHFQFPVGISVIYTGIFAATFTIAGFLHFDEIFCLFHFIWYLLCLPSGYLFLLIYSVCNINNEKWGTREEASPKNGDLVGWVDYFVSLWHKFLDSFCIKCFKRKPPTVPEEPSDQPTTVNHKVDDLHPEPKLSEGVINWLEEIRCDKCYEETFRCEGYTEKEFIATMNMKDIEEIGITKRGYKVKLEREAKKLPTPEIQASVPESVSYWLDSLRLPQYKTLFETEGYSTVDDVESLKGLTEDDLRDIGITRRAHLNQLMLGLRYLQYPSNLDIRINKTRAQMEIALKDNSINVRDSEEYSFWEDLVAKKLKPESANLSKVEELKKSLRDLRNFCLLIVLLTNIMWIVFLYTLVFEALAKYNLPVRAFSLLFLLIFSVIVLIQFIAMLFHRFITLLHVLAGIRPTRKDIASSDWVDVSLMPQS